MASYKSQYILLYGVFTCNFVYGVSQYSGYSMYGTVISTNVNTSVTVASNEYAKANFGSSLPTDPTKYFNGILHQPHTLDDCTNFSKPPNNTNIRWIAIIARSLRTAEKTCSFIDKVYAGQQLGFSAVIIYDYEFDNDGIAPMYSDNDTLTRLVTIPSAFVSYSAGMSMCRHSYNIPTDPMVMAEFHPFGMDFIDPYKILIPLAFSFIGILLVAIIVMIVRWCHAFRRRRRSRISKSQLRKLPLVEYKDGDQYDCCAICLDDYEVGEKVRQLPCAHTYHKKCIDPWLLKNKKTCPVCKRRVVPKRHRRRPRRLSDSSESDDVEALRTERHPLLGAPAGRDSHSSESDDEVRGYGATGIQSSLARISEESGNHGGAAGYSSPEANQRPRHMATQRPSHFADDEDSDECDDLRNPADFLAASSLSSRLADSHSLHTLSNESNQFLIPPLPEVSDEQRTADLRRAIDIEDSLERNEPNNDVFVAPNNDDNAPLLANDSNQNVII